MSDRSFPVETTCGNVDLTEKGGKDNKREVYSNCCYLKIQVSDVNCKKRKKDKDRCKSSDLRGKKDV